MTNLQVRIRTLQGAQAYELVIDEPTDLFGGRDSGCQLVLRESDSSRFHFMLHIDPPRIRIQDLGSLNGTFVNGHRIGARAPEDRPADALAKVGLASVALESGDTFRVGDTVFQATVEGIPESREDLIPSPRRFEKIRELGRGAFGVVYLACDRTDERQVAMKLLKRPPPHEGFDRVLTFLRELELHRHLAHDNVVELRSWGQFEASAYCILEYCAGGSLADRLGAHHPPLSPVETEHFLRQALTGLAYCHRRGVVHRDVKPSNILLASDEGPAKIADFGLAKLHEAAGGYGLTKSGFTGFKGSLPYASPEQLDDCKYARPDADVYGLAASVYVLLTGKHPVLFTDSNWAMIRKALLESRRVPIRTYRPDVPARLAEAIDHALDPEERFADASDFLDALK